MPEVLEGTAFTSVTLVIKNPLVSSAFNVQVSGLHLKIIRATFNYIKDNWWSSVFICGQKNNYQGGLHGREKINLFDLCRLRLIIKFQTYYYSFQKLNFPFHQRNSFKSVSSVVKKKLSRRSSRSWEKNHQRPLVLMFKFQLYN